MMHNGVMLPYGLIEKSAYCNQCVRVLSLQIICVLYFLLRNDVWGKTNWEVTVAKLGSDRGFYTTVNGKLQLKLW